MVTHSRFWNDNGLLQAFVGSSNQSFWCFIHLAKIYVSFNSAWHPFRQTVTSTLTISPSSNCLASGMPWQITSCTNVCAAWFWDEMVVQRRRVSPSRNCSLMYDLIYIIRCYPWLDHSCCCIQRVAANPASMSQFCYLQDGIHTNTSKTADPTLQMHPKKWTIQTAVHWRSTNTRSKNPNPKPKFHGHAANPRLKMKQKEETSQTAEHWTSTINKQ